MAELSDPQEPTPRLTHLAAATQRLDACTAFYRRFAAMRLVKSRGEPGERVFWLAPASQDAPLLVLIEHPGPPADPDPLLRHLGFELPSRAAVDAVHARLHDAGLAPTDPEFVDEVVGYVCLARDPDGRVVEFAHGQDVGPAGWD